MDAIRTGPLRPLFLAAAALVVSASSASAQQPQGPPTGARPGGPGGMPGQPPQAGPGIIRGTVVDAATGRGLGRAQVAVRSAADSSLVTGAVARADGTFRIEGLRPGRYLLRVTALSYAAARTAVLTVTPAAPSVDAGAIRLTAAGITLEGITATAERSEVAMAPDRNTYQARTIAAAGGTAVDVLRNVPAVEVDADGNVSLRGNSSVAIQINGRAAPLTGTQLARFLQGLPSTLVDKVEVVPNPSAKNDPEGLGGIINIVLKQGTDLGTSGGFSLGAATGDKYNASGNLGWQRGKLTLFGTYGFNRDSRDFRGGSLQRNLGARTSLDQDLLGGQAMHGHNLTGNAEYKLDPRTSLATNLMYSRRAAAMDQNNLYRQYDADSSLSAMYRDLTDGNMHGNTFDGALSLKRAWQPQRNELSVEGRYNQGFDVSHNVFTRDALTSAGAVVGSEPGRTRDALDMHSRAWTGQVDWTRFLAPKTKLETGYKGTLRRIDNDYVAEQFSYAGSGGWQGRPGQSNAFRYDERVNAAYAVLSQSVGKVDLQGGLRAEHASTGFDLGAAAGGNFDNSYNSLFPSALAAYNLSPSRQVKASYSRRIQRPDTRMLNPFLFYQDPRHAWQGNPYLKPEYTDAFELGLQQSGALGSLQVTPFYRHTTNAMRPVQTIDSTGFSTTTAQNFATLNTYGADVNGSLKLGTRVQAFGGFSLFKLNADATNVGAGLATSTLSWSTRANATLKLDSRTDVQAFVMYRAPMKSVTGRMGAFSMSNLSIRRKLQGDRSSLSLRLADPFDQMGFRSVTSSPEFWQETNNKFGVRAAYLTYSYNFGHAPRIRAPRPDASQPTPDADPRGGPGGPG